jgi:hypothetical protein
MRYTLIIFIPAAFSVLAARAEPAPVSSRGHLWPDSSRGEAFPDNGPRYRPTSGHGHHRRHTHGRARPAERERRTEPLGQRALPEHPEHMR